MVARQDDGSEDADGSADGTPAHAADRQWRHPSEVGLAVRGEVDRRRSGYAATALLIGGVGVLVGGLLLGSVALVRDLDAVPVATADPLPPSVAEVTLVSATGDTSRATGVVLDREGHIVVGSADLDATSDIWVRCGSAQPVAARLVGEDPRSGVSVLRADTSGVEPARPASSRPTMLGTGIDVVDVGHDELRRTGASMTLSHIAYAAHPVGAPAVAERVTLAADPTLDPPVGAGAVFDPGGDLVGLLRPDGADDTMTLVPARTLRALAEGILADQQD